MITQLLAQFRRLKSLFRFLIPKTKKQGLFTAIFVFAGISVFIFFPQVTDAQAVANTAAFTTNFFIELFANVLLWLARICISLTVFSLKFFVEIAKYNGYVDAPVVQIGWLMVRDVANMFFVVVLLVIAFGTILGLEQYEWKKTLVNFILAAVFVNFSKLIAGIIIDAAHVFTITFLNAIIAVAGGNLVNMFHLDQIMQIIGNDGSWGSDVSWALFGGAVMALVFAAMAMMTMASYTIIMLYRLVVLWVAIVLSPLAYIFAVLPQTKSYAQEWWSEFGKHVMVAPVMVFFLWLAFAALGSGNFVADLNMSLDGEQKAASAVGISGSPTTAVSLSKVTTWENMANFFIAIAFLMVGLERVQKLGVKGGEYTSKALDFGKKVAMVASGAAAAKWAIGGATKGAMGLGAKGLKAAAWYAPVVGGEKWATRAKTQWEDVKAKYYGAGMKSPELAAQVKEELGQTTSALAEKQAELAGLSAEDRAGDKGKTLEKEVAGMQKQQKSLEAEYSVVSGKSGVMGWFAAKGISEEKRLKKTENLAANRREILWKRSGSEAGGYLPLKTSGKDQDRIERGWLAAEKMRAEAKDKEFETLGKKQSLSRARVKDGKLETLQGTVAERIAEHEMNADIHQNGITKLQGEAKIKLQIDDNKIQRGKGLSYSYSDFAASQAHAQLVTNITKEMEKQTVQNAEKGIYRAGTDLDDLGERLLAGQYDETMRNLFDEQKTLGEEEGILRGEIGLSDLDEKLKEALTTREKTIKEVEQVRNDEWAADSEIQALQNSLNSDGQYFVELDKKGKERTDEENDIFKALSEAIEEDRKKLGERKDEVWKNSDKRPDLESDLQKADINIVEAQKAVADLQKQFEAKSIDLEEFAKGGGYAAQKRTEGYDDNKIQSATKWQEFLNKKSANKKAIDSRKGELKAVADKLRKGDGSVVEQVIDKIQRDMQDALAKGNVALVKELEKDLKKAQDVKSTMKDGTLAWRYGKAKGVGADITRGYRYAHNYLTSQAEQREVHDARGVSTPKTTLNEGIEEFGKAFGNMSIDSFMANVSTAIMTMLKKSKDGKVTEQDRMSLMGLYKRGFDRAWIDDAISAILKDPKASEEIGEVLGWTSEVATEDKVRDVSMLFASGDLDFVKKNAVATTVTDVAVHDYGMSEADAIEGMRTGVFKDEATTKKIKDTIEARKKEFNIRFGTDQQEMFDDIFNAATDASAKARSSINISSWLNTTRDRQSELEFVGNLRGDALKNGHPENAGWALSKNVGRGENIYLGMGVRSARAHVMGDARKMGIRERFMQSHAYGDLHEKNGQTFMRIFADKYADLMSGVDPRSFANYANTRLVLNMQGLSGSDKAVDFVQDGIFHAGKMFDDKGELTNAGKNWASELENDKQFGAEFKASKTQEAQQAVMAKAMVQRVFATQGKGEMKGLVLALAAAAGVDGYTAASEGTINMKIYNPKHKEVREYKNINEWIEAYNKGDWGDEAPKDKLQNFVASKNPKKVQEQGRKDSE